MQNGFKDRVSLIWKVADQLRGDYKPYDYAKVILPLVVLRRLDCVLADTKAAVLAAASELEGKVTNMEPVLLRASGQSFYNTSKLDFPKLLDDPANIGSHLRQYIASFSPGAAEVMTRFKFDAQIAKMEEEDLLYRVIGMFANVDLHPNSVSNHEMGYIFEELIRGFSEQSNETAGEHFTPREVIRLMVSLLFAGDDPTSWKNGTIKTLYDPTCGTGGMLSVAEDFLRELNEGIQLEVFGQELNDESYAICRSDMMIKGQDPSHIHFGNTLTRDGEPHRKFDYMLSNPPFGVEWKKAEPEVRKEATTQGFDGRFGAGLPKVSDGAFLFLQHMIAKMKPVDEGGSRLAIVFNGSPLSNGDAGGGESEIRRWIIENDWLDAVIALPDEIFYNTPLPTYFWIVSNRKAPERKGKVQLIDARDCYVKMRRGLGDKRKEIPPDQAAEIIDTYVSKAHGPRSRIVANHELGYLRVTRERPLFRDGVATTDKAGRPMPDPHLRVVETVPLPAIDLQYEADTKARLQSSEYVEAADSFLAREILPHVPDAWIDHTRTKIGYEVRLVREFFSYSLPRSEAEIDVDLSNTEAAIGVMLNEPRTVLTPAANWQLVPLWQLFAERDEPGVAETPMLAVTIARGIILQDELAEHRTLWQSDDATKSKAIAAGDLAYNKMRMWQGAVGLAPVAGRVSSDYVVLRAIGPVEPAFFEALFRTQWALAMFRSWSRGIADDRNRLYWEEMRNMRFPCPSIEVQREVVSTLQAQSGRIRRLRELVTQEERLLAERFEGVVADIVLPPVERADGR